MLLRMTEAHTPGTGRARAWVTAILFTIGIGLIVWMVDRLDLTFDDVRSGFSRVGAWFLAIVGLMFVRFALRSKAWMALTTERIPLAAAIAATISGDALGNVTPLGLVASEPAKAIYLRHHASPASTLASLTAENFFYSVSVAAVILGGTITLLATLVVPEAFRSVVWLSLAAMGGVIALAVWLVHQRPAVTVWVRRMVPARRLSSLLDKFQTLETQTYSALSASPSRLGVVLSCEVAFHVASIAEAWLTLTLLRGSATFLDAFLLDTVNRLVNVVFRAIPMRVGVDEVTSSGFAEMLGLGSASGLTLALVRKARMLFWAAVGLTLLGRRAIGRIL
jgi:hypothetical protein